MSGPPPIEGERAQTVVASRRRGVSKTATVAIFTVATAAVISAVFWRDSNQRDRIANAAQAAPMQMGQIAPFERALPVAMVTPPLAVTPSLSQVFRDAVAQPVAPVAPPKRMLSFAVPATPVAAPVIPQPKPDAERTGIAFRAGVIPGGKAGRAVDVTYLLMPGVVKCVLENAIDTTQPGPIFCHTSADTYSPMHVLLMEKGTSITGSYTSNMQQGQNRLPAVTAFALTPTGVPVALSGPMGDALGRSGITGEVDTHFWDKFGGALLLMTSQGAMSAASSALQHGSGNSNVNLNTGQVEGAVSEVLRNTINIPPTVRVDQGSEVGLLVTMPIDFRDAYQLRETQ